MWFKFLRKVIEVFVYTKQTKKSTFWKRKPFRNLNVLSALISYELRLGQPILEIYHLWFSVVQLPANIITFKFKSRKLPNSMRFFKDENLFWINVTNLSGQVCANSLQCAYEVRLWIIYIYNIFYFYFFLEYEIHIMNW